MGEPVSNSYKLGAATAAWCAGRDAAAEKCAQFAKEFRALQRDVTASDYERNIAAMQAPAMDAVAAAIRAMEAPYDR